MIRRMLVVLALVLAGCVESADVVNCIAMCGQGGVHAVDWRGQCTCNPPAPRCQP